MEVIKLILKIIIKIWYLFENSFLYYISIEVIGGILILEYARRSKGIRAFVLFVAAVYAEKCSVANWRKREEYRDGKSAKKEI
jgi:hypothetical protein